MLTAVFEPHEARKALRAPRARDEAQLHLRKGDLGVAARHAIVTAQRELEPAAHAGAADGRDDRLGGRFDASTTAGRKGSA